MADARGTEVQLEVFVAAEHDRLVGLLALYIGDRWVAEELAQEALVRLCQHWPRVSQMANQRAWLSRVAMNLARSWFRRRAAERRAQQRHGPSASINEADDSPLAVTMWQAVMSLPERQRLAVALRFYTGLSVAETARVMRCAEGTVKALTHRATTALRSVEGLQDHQETAHDR